MTKSLLNSCRCSKRPTPTSSNVLRISRCALSTGEQSVTKVLQWLERRFASEQLIVVQAIIDIALNRRQRSSRTLRTIIPYGVLLLQRVEHRSNPERKEKIQAFASQLIQQ